MDRGCERHRDHPIETLRERGSEAQTDRQTADGYTAVSAVSAAVSAEAVAAAV